MSNRPERFTTVPPGCSIELAEQPTTGDYALLASCQPCASSRGIFVRNRGEGMPPSSWPVLRPSADNKYGCLPWDIPIPVGYEPDGEWEPKEGEKAAYRKVAAGDTFIDKCGSGLVAFADSWFNAGSESRLCVRRIKTRRTVVEIELATCELFSAGDALAISKRNGAIWPGTITAVREVER